MFDGEDLLFNLMVDQFASALDLPQASERATVATSSRERERERFGANRNNEHAHRSQVAQKATLLVGACALCFSTVLNVF